MSTCVGMMEATAGETSLVFYTITLFNLVAPPCSLRQVILFRETGVVH